MCEYPERDTSSGSGARVIGVFLLALIAASALSSVMGFIGVALLLGFLALVAGSVTLVLWHLHRHLGDMRLRVQQPRYVPQMRAQRQPWQVPASRQPPAVEQGGQHQHLHLHLGDLTPAERAEALRQIRGR